MSMEHIQDILPDVEMPSRYLGNEVNAIRKDLAQVDLRVAMAFPDLYEIGTSHFGLQILYAILNRRDDIAAERVFAPAPDMEKQLRDRGLPLVSLESGLPLARFDIIGFSLLYELNYTGVLSMLDLSGIPLFSRERNANHPFIIAGGPCTCNPEPVADFFDAMVIGDGEAVVERLADAWLEWRRGGNQRRESLLDAWSEIPGVYIPAFFTPQFDDRGFQRLIPLRRGYARVTRAFVDTLEDAPFPTAPIVPFGRPVHDRLRLELSRGCTRGCRYCQAGMIYRPVRERSPEKVLDLCDAALAATGYEDVSLLSLSTGDYRCIVPLMEQLLNRYACDRVALSLPSLRAGTLTPELMALIKRVRKTGFTIAPEAGSQRLRDVINKNITNGEIRATVRDAFAQGWKVIKLYFMIGLPTETPADLDALVDLVHQLKSIQGPGRLRPRINVSVATFIPKAHTPFQWSRQIRLEESREKINRLHDRLKSPGIHFKWQNPEISMLEGLWARGDRRLSALLLKAYQAGCRLDGWSDHFNARAWQSSLDACGIDPESAVYRARETEEPLPWDHIDMKVSRDFLQAERDKALAGETTEDCRDGACQNCGVCDFEHLRPIVHPAMAGAASSEADAAEANPDAPRERLAVTFTKTGPARLLGHLEMANIFKRALRRAGIAVHYSRGFHPNPKVVFTDTLPLGMESLCERMIITLETPRDPAEVVRRLRPQLPAGLDIAGCEPFQRSSTGDALVSYRVQLEDTQFPDEPLAVLARQPHFFFERRRRKGRLKKIDLKAMLTAIERVAPDTLEFTLHHKMETLVRPADVLGHLFGFDTAVIKHARVTKLNAFPATRQTAASTRRRGA
ncbi:MAG: TIGR03960 family B12-binding radical SAM protein [Desulfobacterales bacterium]|nr:TIGR03960 family B12-binding radical SAM protein [Desulfobacterales bacterium]